MFIKNKETKKEGTNPDEGDKIYTWDENQLATCFKIYENKGNPLNSIL